MLFIIVTYIDGYYNRIQNIRYHHINNGFMLLLRLFFLSITVLYVHIFFK